MLLQRRKANYLHTSCSPLNNSFKSDQVKVLSCRINAENEAADVRWRGHVALCVAVSGKKEREQALESPLLRNKMFLAQPPKFRMTLLR